MPHSPQDLHKKLLGKKGERLVADYLKKQGYKILEKNYRTPFGEADIIAQDRDELVFIEVKTRTSDQYGTPAESVVKRKRETYAKIAKFYWLQSGEEPNARFDVAEVYADGRIEYIANAF
ncbi:MAG: YraN family protein [Clostridia bacterium]|nr:YraN family protein [Clostridia bacterium]